MNQTLRPQPLLAEVLPGALTLGLMLWVLAIKDPALVELAQKMEAAQSAIAAGAFLFASWMVGTFVDSIRNLLEHCWDRRWGALKWDFFFYGARDRVAQLDEHYFAYYTAKANYVIGLVAVAVLSPVLLFCSPVVAAVVVGVLVGGVSLWDAILLRGEIRPLLESGPESLAETKSSALHRNPHDGVFTRLKRSAITGIGVFAIRDIPAGTNVFAGDTGGMCDIDPSTLVGLPPEIRKLYDDFCVSKSGKMMKGPTSFNNLTVGWYLNHSAEPNVRCGEDYDFFAIRDIKNGEELTADYSTYDDRPPPGAEGRRG